MHARDLRWFFNAGAVLFASIGVVLFFYDLSWIGSTWDELVDYSIASDFVHNGNFIQNTLDPSQGRLNHIIGALAMKLAGGSLLAFKLPFVGIGILGGLLLFLYVKSHYSFGAAIFILAYYFTNPYVLGSARSAATAGDILVSVLSFVGLLTAVAWIKNPLRLPSLIFFSICVGLGIGAKLSQVVWVPVGAMVILWYSHYGLSRLQVRQVGQVNQVRWYKLGKELIIYLVVLGIVAFLSHPLFFKGIEFNFKVLRDVSQWSNTYVLGQYQSGATLAYVPALFVSKFTVGFMIMVMTGLWLGLVRWVRSGEKDLSFIGAVLLLCVTLVFAFKKGQSIHYYTPAIFPMMFLCCEVLRKYMESPRLRDQVGISIVFLGLIGYQIYLSLGLTPDFLQAGRNWGPRFQGEFSGPAVNHCQGGPYAIQALNEFTKKNDVRSVYLLDHCQPVLDHEVAHGPIKPENYKIIQYPNNRNSMSLRPYFLMIHNVYYFYRISPEYYEQQQAKRSEATRNCNKMKDSFTKKSLYEIYYCAT